MDKEEQRKVVEGLTLLLEESITKTNKDISSGDFDNTTSNIRVSKQILEIMAPLTYFPTGELRRLIGIYSNSIMNAEKVFVNQVENPRGGYNLVGLLAVIK